MDKGKSIEDARQQYLLHEAAARECRMAIARAQRDRSAHEQIMEGLAMLFPVLKREAQERRTEAAEKVATSRATLIDTEKAVLASPELIVPLTDTALRERTDPRPRGAAAVKRILSRYHRGEFLTSTAVHKEMAARGWVDDSDNGAAAVRASLNRLVKSGQIVKRATDGREMEYAWKSPALAELMQDPS